MDSACHATGFISVSPKIAKRRLFFVPHVIGQNFSIPLPVCLSRIVFFAVQIHWQEWLHAKVLLLFVQFTTAPKKSIIVLISSFSLLIHLSRFFFIPSLRNSSFTLAASRKLKIPPRVLLPRVCEYVCVCVCVWVRVCVCVRARLKCNCLGSLSLSRLPHGHSVWT